MARPSKYNWDEIAEHKLAGMDNKKICEVFGCKPSSLSEELKKRGIVEVDPIRVGAKNALVDAVRKVSEVTEKISENSETAMRAVMNVAAVESGHRLILESILDEATGYAAEVMREKRANGELTIMDAKQVVDLTSKHIETRYGKSIDMAITEKENIPQIRVVYEQPDSD